MGNYSYWTLQLGHAAHVQVSDLPLKNETTRCKQHLESEMFPSLLQTCHLDGVPSYT